MEKPTFGEKFRALMATGRVANLPTVWSNVLVAFWISWEFFSNQISHCFFLTDPKWSLALTLISTSTLYVGACMLGDYRDLHFDTKYRPNRPIPKGTLKARNVAVTAYAFIAFALFIAVLNYPISWVLSVDYINGEEALPSSMMLDIFGIMDGRHLTVTLLLFASVVLYAFHHKKMKFYAIINMASCRFFLITCAAVTAAIIHNSYHSTLWIFALVISLLAFAVALYTFLLSSVASTESTPEHYRYRKILAVTWFSLPLLCWILNYNLAIHSENPASMKADLISVSVLPLFTAIYIVWGIFTFKALKTSKPTFVSRALAGFCLLDACFAATCSPALAAVCLGLFCLALLLQRVAPAT
ncbi:MAG: hypothetical protein ACSHX0_04385 [Akkermansiaceae bacterium]